MTALAGCRTAQPVAADPFLDSAVSIDTHAHPGAMWRRNANVSGALDRIKASHLSAFANSVPSDSPILKRDANRRIVTARRPGAGELYSFAKSGITGGIEYMKQAGIDVALSPADILASKRAGRKACILALEGGGFAADRFAAIEEMYGLGVRIVQPMHYNTFNPFGDVQGPTDKGGLTQDGLAFVKGLDRLGIVLDAAHMTMEGVAKAVDKT